MKYMLPLIAALALATPALARPIHSVGAVTWHATRYAGKVVEMKGYLLRRHKGYVLFSDEPSGGVSSHDLPVTGAGIDTIKPRWEYLITGRFVKGGLKAANHTPYHLELLGLPKVIRH